jgi:DNA invertase Pin-like site-specific DNA recombinase
MQRTMNPGFRWGIYVRISRFDGDADTEGAEARSGGTKRQEADCRAVIEDRGGIVAGVYIDDDRSAFSGKRRKDYERLCDDLKNHVLDGVMVWHTDRLHRSNLELEHFVTLIELTGAKVVSVTGGDYDLETSDGRFKARIMGSVAVKESEDKSRRLRRMHADKIKNGEPNGGGRPYGYLRVGLKKDPDDAGRDTRREIPHPDEAPIVVEVIDRLAAGQTLTAIADDLNARGVPTARGARWTLANIRRMAVNPRYIGRRTHQGQDAGKATYPGLVDEATWRRANALLNADDRPKRRTARRYLLGGALVFCGKCHQPLRSKQMHAPSGNVPVYACRPRKQGGCGGVTVRAEPLEELVKEWVLDYVESATFAKALQRREGGDRKVAANVDKLRAQLEQYKVDHESGAIDYDEYKRFRAATQARLAEALASLTVDTTHAAVGRYAGRGDALRERWESPQATLDERQSIVRSVVGRVVVDPIGRGQGGREFRRERVHIDPAI